MRSLHHFASRALASLAALALAAATATTASSQVVISELATRGPASATDEFVELYNPTSAPIDLSGWKLQYKSTSGTTWNDRAILPASTVIAAHGYFLIGNQTSYSGPAADYMSALWNSGTGMADNGHERIINAAAVEVDKVGWGTAIDPEGIAAPNHGTSANGLSLERKALSSSTADSLGSGGAHALLGNGQDTNNNSVDFVVQTHGRSPQNAASAIEPALAVGGNGTGLVSVSPSLVFANQSVASLAFAITQDSSYTLASVAILVPAGWTWSHSAGDVSLSGAGLGGASASVTGDTVFVTGAAITTANPGTVTVANLTAPATKGASIFTTRTAIAAGTLTPIAAQPSVRALELVPIVTLHVNDASGVAASPYAVGAEATVSGIVTANLSSTRTDVYVQDVTGGINLFNAALGPITLAPGDSITVTGTILQFRGLTELQPDFALLTRHSTGRPVPEPLVVSCADVNATFHLDWTEPNESRLIRINGVTYNSITSTITDASGTTNIFIPASYPPAPSVFDVIGVLKQFKPGTPAPGPPYTADYEISPRTPDDIIAHPGPILLTTPYEDQIAWNSVRINWTTDVASTSVVRYGLTPALGDSAVDAAAVTNHALTVSGLQPATLYYYSAGSADGNGANFSATSVFITASTPASTGLMHVYFNKSVNTGVMTISPANGNVDLPAQLVPRLDGARRSIDAAIYNLSGTPGTTLANALIAAKNRGVNVRVICEYDNQATTAFNSLTSAGIPLINDRFDPVNFGAGLMHNKFFVIDGRAGAPESAWVWTGSWNPTDPGTNNDYQNAIEIQDQSLAKVYTMEFDEMWGSSTSTPNASVSRFGARKLDDTPHRFSIGGKAVECYFSPSDGTTFKILTAINAAQHSLGFELLTLTRSDLANGLIARKNAGLKVRGDLDNGTDTGSEYGNLVSAGVDVHLNTGGGLLHHKYLVGDAESPGWSSFVLTGSHNWSAAAEASNNENTLVIHDHVIANHYLQEFAARYYQFGGTDSVRLVDVEPVASGPVAALALAPVAPNPVHGRASLLYDLPAAEHVVLRLFDVQGREVKTLVNERQTAGRYRVTIEARGLASGLYFCRLDAGRASAQRKLMVVR